MLAKSKLRLIHIILSNNRDNPSLLLYNVVYSATHIKSYNVSEYNRPWTINSQPPASERSAVPLRARRGRRVLRALPQEGDKKGKRRRDVKIIKWKPAILPPFHGKVTRTKTRWGLNIEPLHWCREQRY